MVVLLCLVVLAACLVHYIEATYGLDNRNNGKRSTTRVPWIRLFVFCFVHHLETIGVEIPETLQVYFGCHNFLRILKEESSDSAHAQNLSFFFHTVAKSNDASDSVFGEKSVPIAVIFHLRLLKRLKFYC